MRLKRGRIQSAPVYLTAVIAAFTTNLPAQSCTTIDIPGAAVTYPTSLNDRGDIAGYYCNSQTCRGFVRGAKGDLAVFDRIPASINNAGTTAGATFVRDRQGSVTEFEIPQLAPPQYPTAGFSTAISESGSVAGYIINQPGSDTWGGFLRDRHGNLNVFSGPIGTVPAGINAPGDIVGHSAPYYNTGNGFIRHRDGEITFFAVPGASGPGPLAYPVGINESGEVTGYYDGSDGPNYFRRGFIRDRFGKFITFDAVPGVYTFPAGINNGGDVAGDFQDETGRHNFLRDRQGRVVTFDCGRAVALNNRGDVAGYFFDASGTHAFLYSH